MSAFKASIQNIWQIQSLQQVPEICRQSILRSVVLNVTGVLFPTNNSVSSTSVSAWSIHDSYAVVSLGGQRKHHVHKRLEKRLVGCANMICSQKPPSHRCLLLDLPVSPASHLLAGLKAGQDWAGQDWAGIRPKNESIGLSGVTFVERCFHCRYCPAFNVLLLNSWMGVCSWSPNSNRGCPLPCLLEGGYKTIVCTLI